MLLPQHILSPEITQSGLSKGLEVNLCRLWQLKDDKENENNYGSGGDWQHKSEAAAPKTCFL